MPLSMPGRPPPAHDRVPAGWLSDGDTTARAGRLMMGDERTGAEARALSDQEIPALLDDRRELAWAYRRWRKTIREEEGARRAQSATAPHDAIPEEEQARRARALAAATPLIEQIRASDRQALRSAKTMEGRQRQRQLVRDFLERELTEANAPLRDRWEEVRRRLETEVTAGRIAAAIWMTASRKLRRLSTCECRATFPAPRDKSRVVLDGEPGRFVVWQNDIDSIFGSPPPSVTKGRVPDQYWEQAEPEALRYFEDEGWGAVRGDLATAAGALADAQDEAAVKRPNSIFSRSTRRPVPRTGARMRTTRATFCRRTGARPTYLDGMLFRGTGDGRVLAYDFKTGFGRPRSLIKKGRSRARRADRLERSCVRRQRGRRLQGRKRAHVCARRQDRQHRLGILSRAQIRGGHDPRASGPVATRQFDLEERARCADQRRRSLDSCDFGSCSGAPVCPLGNPAPDFDIGAREGENLFTDSVVVLDAKTGAYKSHFKIVHRDWHDWDVSNPPALIRTAGGKRLMAVSPKDGYLYGFDLADNKLLYRTPVTTTKNVEEPFSTDKDVHFCAGAAGGEEWNSPAYDPRTNLILTGDVDWCTTVRLQTREEIVASPLGQPWTAEKSINPFNEFGAFSRADDHWSGWLHAVDADTGVWKWRVKTNYPIVGGVTPTAARFLRRCRRQLLCGRRRQRPEALGSEDRRHDRRRGDHL